MKREEFYRALNDNKRPDYFDERTVDKILEKAITNPKSNVICMEELAELQKEISKFERGIGNRLGLVEELTDAVICINMLIKKYNIEDDVMCKAEAIKLQRVWLNNGGTFKELDELLNKSGGVKNWIL